MLHYLLTALTVLLVTLQSVLKKQYTSKSAERASVFMFPMLSSGASILFFLALTGFKPELKLELIGYSAAFAISFATALVGSVAAIKYGPLSITLLITSYSLVIPTLYGLFALHESVTQIALIGLLLLFISLFMTNYRKGSGEPISFKWVISVAAAFVGNGMCSTFQKMQQNRFEGRYKSEFMLASMIIVFLLTLILMLLREKNSLSDVKKCTPYAALCGVANAVVNYLVMLLTGIVPNIILFPLISAGGIVIGYFIATHYYGEKLNRMQNLGYISGVLSVILLNL